VQIHEVGEHHGLPYFSLEFCPGGSLEKKLSGTPLPPAEAAKLVRTLAAAVQAAHDKGILHRDLKPANVLLAEDGTPKITDFGLAKKLGDQGQTRTGDLMGTPSYMAPEQADGKRKEIGPAVDVYALGAILYELLVGKPPFRGVTLLDTLDQVRSQEPVPPSRLQPTIPRDLERICLKCLSKDPHQRYASANKIAEDLGRLLAGQPIHARSPSLAYQVRWWCSHRDRIRDAGFFSVWLILVVAAWALCGLVVHAVGAMERGARWPFENSTIPSNTDTPTLRSSTSWGFLAACLYLCFSPDLELFAAGWPSFGQD
jgi:serine/threonine protein kinase